jgi:hypothetical protein
MEIDFRIIIGRAHNNMAHAWIESPEGDIIDPTYGQFDGGPALRVMPACYGHEYGHCGELVLDLDQEEFYRRSIKPRSERDGWSARSRIKGLFSDYPFHIETESDAHSH